jgi:hypothetical protein
MKTQNVVFLDVMTCRQEHRYLLPLPSTHILALVCSSETLVPIYQTIQLHNPVGHNLILINFNLPLLKL